MAFPGGQGATSKNLFAVAKNLLQLRFSGVQYYMRAGMRCHGKRILRGLPLGGGL